MVALAQAAGYRIQPGDTLNVIVLEDETLNSQVLVLPDMLGLNTGFKPRFLRHFADLGEQASAGVEAYVAAVKGGEYPAAEHTFT